MNKGSFYIESNPSRIKTFINFYEVELEENKIKLHILSTLSPKYPKDYLKKINNGILINAGFTYNVDFKAEKSPIDFTYNLHIENNCLLNLPTYTKTAIIEKDGKIEPRKIKASGCLYFGNIKILWIGSHEKQAFSDKKMSVVYGISNQGLIKSDLGIIPNKKQEWIKLSKGYKNIIIDIAFLKKDRILYIKKITNQKTKLFDGIFILQTPNEMVKKLKVGLRITDWIVDGLSPKNTDFAVTSGIQIPKSIKKLYQNIMTEKIVITRRADDNNPYYSNIEQQKARSCIFKTGNLIHFLLIDARPRIIGQQGISIPDLANYIYRKNHNVKWAINCDGGQSSKICLKQKGKLRVFGNLHYLNLKKLKPEWNGENGRPITSCVIAFPKNKY
ncbi:MAG: hypothetical protein Q8N22_03285 [bacterium]|nr:hypothetical protein [bacterium]